MIEKDGITYLGVKEIANIPHCECCNNDLSVKGSVRFDVHLDGENFYENRYTCNKCGSQLIVIHPRKR